MCVVAVVVGVVVCVWWGPGGYPWVDLLEIIRPLACLEEMLEH